MINEKQLKHMAGVAQYMHDNAGRYDLNPEEMYVVGLLHNIGYLLGDEYHERYGGEILFEMGIDLQYILPIIHHHEKNADFTPGRKIHALLIEALEKIGE